MSELENDAISLISDVSETLSDIKNKTGFSLPDDILNSVEALIALYFSLTSASNWKGVCSSLFLYTKCHLSRSVSGAIIEYFMQETNTVTDQDGEETCESEPGWLMFLRSLKENWKLCLDCKLFSNFSKLLGVLVVAGLCEASDLTFDIGRFRVFAPSLKAAHATASDVVDAVLGTVTMFAEGMYMSFQTGSFTPMLMNNHEVAALDTEYMNILQWWPLVKNGNLQRMKDISDHEFTNRAAALGKKFKKLLPTLTGIDKKLIGDKIYRLAEIENDLVAMKVAGGLRRAPFSIELFGESCQGKSTLGDQIIDVLLTSQDMPLDNKFRACYKAGDRYDSNWTSDKTVMIIDDIANEKPETLEKSPTRAIIDICNNVMTYANKAEIEAKARCFIEPLILLLTTNKKDLDAYYFSNCPYSVQRRMKIVITVKAKEKYLLRNASGNPIGLDSAKIRREYTDADGNINPPMIEDLWELTLEVAVQPKKLTSIATYEVVVWNGKEMRDVSAQECINYLIEKQQEHIEDQDCIITTQQSRKRMQRCKVDGCRNIKGYCPVHKVEDQLGALLIPTLKTCSGLFSSYFDDKLGKLEAVATDILYKETKNYLKTWDWIHYVPSHVFDHPMFLKMYLYFNKHQLKLRLKRWAYTMIFIAILLVYFYGFSFASPFIVLAFFIFIYLVRTGEGVLIRALRKRHVSAASIIQHTRDENSRVFTGCCIAVGALITFLKLYQLHQKVSPQGNLQPSKETDVIVRDAQVNPYIQVKERKLPLTQKSKCSVEPELCNIVQKNLVYVSLSNDDSEQVFMADAMFIKSNLLLIPDHYFDKYDSYKVVCRKKDPEKLGGKFRGVLEKATSVLIPSTDIRVCYIATGGSYKNLIDYFPTATLPNMPFHMIWRDKEGDIVDYYGSAIQKITSNSRRTFKGGDYAFLSGNTFNGLCGAPLLSQGRGASIMGIHLGGIADTPTGVYGQLLQKELFDAVELIKGKTTVLVTGDQAGAEPVIMGKNIYRDVPLHPKSPVNFLPEQCQLAYRGSVIGQVTAQSKVTTLAISDSVEQFCGSTNVYMRPKMNPHWWPWQTCMAHMSVPGQCFPDALLDRAMKDYMKPLLYKLDKEIFWNKNIFVLNDDQNVNGIPGMRFVDSMDLSTSIGFPLTGPKTEYVLYEDPNDESSKRTFVPLIMDEIERVENCYKRGERANIYAKACLKDEVLTKEKCRIFYASPIALIYLVRKYFLTITRFIHMNPIVSECAVGINAMSDEWQQLHDHVHSKSENLFAGDYGKFDQKLPAQIILASIKILIMLAQAAGYDDESIKIMEAMAGDIVYCHVNFNGDLLSLIEGGHISGNSMTVDVNSLGNVLNLRCYFFHTYPKAPSFRDAVAITSYGDDNAGTVDKRYPKFNIKDYSEWLEQYGQKYTMPDKESTLVPYLPKSEFEFLKRKSSYIEEIDLHVGALDESSIFKSLHMVVKSTLPMDEACGTNLNTALYEWFAYGRFHYEMRRAQVQKIAEKHNLLHMVPNLRKDFDTRVAEWKEQYLPDSNPTGVALAPDR